MNSQRAREILTLFRPGTADEQDPAFAEARQLAKSDPELARWFEAHCDSTRVLRVKLRAIPAPAGLKEQILSERTVHRPVFQRYWGPILAAAAIVALLLGIQTGFWPFRSSADYPAFQKRMTQTVLRGYYMDDFEKDPEKVRDFLKDTNAPADYVLPSGLSKAPLAGCAVLSWQGSKVSVLCFKSGRPLAPGLQSDLWFVVINRKAVIDGPPESSPTAAEFKRVNKAMTANWSDSQHTYLLAAVGDEAFLQKYLH